MSLELFNQLEQKVTDTVDALEMMKLENEELRGENAKLKEEREEWSVASTACSASSTASKPPARLRLRISALLP
ncbi:cell division protein ZapB [Halomonas sp. PA16-9]|uniref:cell division protein ZapB n=1 Tax=Halomonas sp. PA16-9 TaxID=2576841 RepID=UPI0012DAE936|nr:cell division protein ZapB [Halomonas sp. PA16-9]